MDKHNKSMPLPKQLNPKDRKGIIRNLDGTDSAELNQFSYNGSFIYFDRLSFQVEIEEEQTPFTVTKMNTVQTGVLTYQLNIYDWITSIANSKSRFENDAEYLFDEESWSILIE